jgi:hypothetical protein
VDALICLGVGKGRGAQQRLTHHCDDSAIVDLTTSRPDIENYGIDVSYQLLEITTKVNKGEGTLGKLINDPAAYDSLVSTLGEIRIAANEAKTFMSSTQSIIDQVKSGKERPMPDGFLGLTCFENG